jgi:hypothetical protein
MAMDFATDVLTDPNLLDFFSVVRRATTTDENGMTQFTETVFDSVAGVVNVGAEMEFQKQDDPTTQYTVGSLRIVTMFRITSTRAGFLADEIKWRGMTFQVSGVSPYPQYGLGYYIVDCINSGQDEGAPNATDGTLLDFDDTQFDFGGTRFDEDLT